MRSLSKTLLLGVISHTMLLFLSTSIETENMAFAGSKAEIPSNYVVARGGPVWANTTTRSPGGQGSSEIHFKSEYGINIAYGHRFFDWLRLEGELGYLDLKVDGHTHNLSGQKMDMSGHDEHFKAMLNVYADWHNSTAFTPFVGAGLGLSHIRLDTNFPRSNSEIAETNDNVTVFAYQFMGGISWAVHQAWELELSYRYYATNNRTHDNHSAASNPEVDIEGTKCSTVYLGVRFNF